ncbi:MAG: DUF2779 domain-containing protein, partial [Actinomycetota bacterium]
MGKNIIISKSKYLAGLQCLKYFWFLINAKEEVPQPDFVNRFIFNQGTLVGEYAKNLYPDGIDLGKIGDLKEQLARTLELLSGRRPLFEASISSGNVYSRADILVPVDTDSWDIVEVKSSTQLKEEYIPDVAFQKYCFEKAGINIRKCYLTYINNQYVKEGNIDPSRLFKKADITAQVDEKLEEIGNRVREMQEIAAAESPPEIIIGKQCSNPYICPLKDRCWKFLPDNNIFNLYGNKDKAIELYSEGILSIKDIPDRYDLNLKQQIQLECARTEKTKIDKDEISKFIKKLEYPLYFFDFETFSTAIPLYDGLKPYQRIPFQYSIHVLDSIDGKAEHRDFLAGGPEDPRERLLSDLKKHLGDKGSVVVYYELFEKSVLRELAEAFPEYREWADSIINRIIDLYKPFGNFHYYNSSQKGSASVKSVLPA